MVIDVLGRDDLPFPRALPEFQRLFPDEAAYAAYLERARWRGGFTCPHCGTFGEPYRYATRLGVLCCRRCRRETRLTAGTVMERTHTPLSAGSELRTWLPARHPACRPSSSIGNSACRATKPPSRYSISCGREWFAPTKTESVANREKSSRLMKHTWAGVPAVRGVASTI